MLGLLDDPVSFRLLRRAGGYLTYPLFRCGKFRRGARGRGKSGGIRVIYYWHRPRDSLLMLLAYSKNVQGDLTSAQRNVLRDLVKEELR